MSLNNEVTESGAAPRCHTRDHDERRMEEFDTRPVSTGWLSASIDIDILQLSPSKVVWL